MTLRALRFWQRAGVDAPPPPPTAADAEGMPLTHAPTGCCLRIVKIERHSRPALRKLALMGAFPGAAILLHQRSPAYVLQLDRAQFAIDRELAALIRVRLESDLTEPPPRSTP